MKRSIGVAVLIVAVAIASFTFGHRSGSREGLESSLGHALEKTALCANSLNMLAEGRTDGTTHLLAAHLRSSAAQVQERLAAGAEVRMAIPNLLDGLRRAKTYADRVGDTQLSQQLATLHAQLSAQSAKLRE